jgi:hypothetical protein
VERCFADDWSVFWTVSDPDVPDELKDSYTFTAWYRLKRRSCNAAAVSGENR